MSAVAVDTSVRLAAERRLALRAVTDFADEIEPWEAHSELSLVSPEVRRRLLELLPDPEGHDVRPAPPPTAPLPAVPQEPEPAVRLRDLLRYTAALAIVGAIVVLALLAEGLSH